MIIKTYNISHKKKDIQISDPTVTKQNIVQINKTSKSTNIKTKPIKPNLSSENDRATSLLDLLLSGLGNELGLNNNGLVLGQDTLAKNLEVTELGNINQWSVVVGSLVLDLLGYERPELVQVDDGAMELVAELVEIPHTDFTEETRVVLVEENAMVVHTSSVSTTTGMLAVLADTTMACAHVAALLPVLLEAGSHFLSLSLSLSLSV